MVRKDPEDSYRSVCVEIKLEPVGGTALDSEGAGYGGDDGDEELKNLDDGIPIDFNHNTLSLKI